MIVWMRRATLLFALACCPAALAQAPGPASPGAASRATVSKLNAYVALLNRTLRASESLSRYASWVDMRTGPTGRERIVYGLYSLYDVRGEIEKARAATTAEPPMPDLDAEVTTYIAAYDALAPTVTKADGYYERQDYKVDKMAEGKVLHAVLASAGPAFLAERNKIDALFAREKAKSDAAELAEIERRDGRKARWHVADVMIRARQVMDLLPSGQKPVIEMGGFEAALTTYAASVKDLDEYRAANPGSPSAFESMPRSLLGKLREFDEKVARAKGDARRSGGNDLTWTVNDYNMMISMSEVDSSSR